MGSSWTCPEEEVDFSILPALKPIDVNLAKLDKPLPVIAFYCPGSGLEKWDKETGGAPFGNFWPLTPEYIEVTYKGATAKFANTEAAYQCMKWWESEDVRKKFEACKSTDVQGREKADLQGGDEAYVLKKQCENDPKLAEMTLFNGSDKYSAMLLVLRQKWRLPKFKKFLLESKGCLLVEHCPEPGRDLYWTDNHKGGGQNRLGAALMTIRSELLKEEGSQDDWPANVDRPSWAGGKDTGNWQEITDLVANELAIKFDGTSLGVPCFMR